MRWSWRKSAVLAGALTGLAVWCWPVTPLWQSGPGAGKLLGFSPNGKKLITASAPLYFVPPEVCQWDATTGRLLVRASLPTSEPYPYRVVRPSPDGSLVLMGECPADPFLENLCGDEDTPRFRAGDWYLHDGLTGVRKLGPIRGLGMAGLWGVPCQAFSLDARWFYGFEGSARRGLDMLQGTTIYSSMTGKPVYQVPVRRRENSVKCVFAPDGNSAVVLCWHTDLHLEVTSYSVRLVDLPSGKERRVVDFPSWGWCEISRWDGRFLDMIAVGSDTLKREVPEWRKWTFDLTQDPIGKGIEGGIMHEPETATAEGTSWREGRGWRTGFTPGRESGTSGPVQQWWDWFVAWLGVRQPPSRVVQVKARFVEAETGTNRFEMPRLVGYPVEVSPDGRLLASTIADGGVEVWNVDPPPRWPWAAAAGFGAAGGVIALGRWARRGKPRQ